MIKISQIDISELRDYENNPRNNEVAVGKVKSSIERFGFLFPVIVDSRNVIVCGHTRKRACEVLGHKKIPCIIVDNLTDEQIDFFRLVDNRTSEYSTWDFERLQIELSAVELNIKANDLLLKNFDFNVKAFDIGVNNFEIDIRPHNFIEAAEQSIQKDSPDIDPLDGDCLNDFHDIKPVQIKFSCGAIGFAISCRELDLLNEAYAEYLDIKAPDKTFVQYILGGE